MTSVTVMLSRLFVLLHHANLVNPTSPPDHPLQNHPLALIDRMSDSSPRISDAKVLKTEPLVRPV